MGHGWRIGVIGPLARCPFRRVAYVREAHFVYTGGRYSIGLHAWRYFFLKKYLSLRQDKTSCMGRLNERWAWSGGDWRVLKAWVYTVT